MWAMMQKFRICEGGVAAGESGVRARGDMSPSVYVSGSKCSIRGLDLPCFLNTGDSLPRLPLTLRFRGHTTPYQSRWPIPGVAAKTPHTAVRAHRRAADIAPGDRHATTCV